PHHAAVYPGGVRQAGGDAHHHQPGADGRSGDSRRPFGTKQLKKRHRLSACAASFSKQSLRNADIRSGDLLPGKVLQQALPASGFCRGVEACEICQLSQDFRCRIPLSQRVQPCIRVPLAEPLSIASQKQREMVKRRCLQSQQPIQQQLSGGGRQQVRPPHYFCDAHGRVIHHHRQLIGKYAVRPPQQKIPAVRRQPLPVLPHVAVGESDLLLRHPQPQGGGAACAPGPLCRLLRGQTAAGPRVDHLSILPVGSTGGMELRPGTEAGVDQPLGLQSPQSSLIQR
ncbi:Tetratricopeptide repeat protein, partial [Dysosmobacter welbionis]